MNAKDKDEISGLMEASIMGHVAVVKELLKVIKTVLRDRLAVCDAKQDSGGAVAPCY